MTRNILWHLTTKVLGLTLLALFIGCGQRGNPTEKIIQYWSEGDTEGVIEYAASLSPDDDLTLGARYLHSLAAYGSGPDDLEAANSSFRPDSQQIEILIAWCDTLVAGDNQNPWWQYAHGILYSGTGSFGEAAKLFNDAKQLDSESTLFSRAYDFAIASDRGTSLFASARVGVRGECRPIGRWGNFAPLDSCTVKGSVESGYLEDKKKTVVAKGNLEGWISLHGNRPAQIGELVDGWGARLTAGSILLQTDADGLPVFGSICRESGAQLDAAHADYWGRYYQIEVDSNDSVIVPIISFDNDGTIWSWEDDDKALRLLALNGKPSRYEEHLAVEFTLSELNEDGSASGRFKYFHGDYVGYLEALFLGIYRNSSEELKRRFVDGGLDANDAEGLVTDLGSVKKQIQAEGVEFEIFRFLELLIASWSSGDSPSAATVELAAKAVFSGVGAMRDGGGMSTSPYFDGSPIIFDQGRKIPFSISAQGGGKKIVGRFEVLKESPDSGSYGFAISAGGRRFAIGAKNMRFKTNGDILIVLDNLNDNRSILEWGPF